MPMASYAPPDPNVHIDDLDVTGMAAPPSTRPSVHGSVQGDTGAPSTHRDQASEHPSPQSKEPSHLGVPLDAQQPPPIPRPDHNPGVVEDIYIDTATTADRIHDNLWLTVSLALATVFWLIALVSQAIVTGNLGNAFVRTAWLALVLQLLLILLTSTLLLTTHLPPYHIQISTLAAMVVVLGSLAVDANIYSPNTSAQKAMAAAWILTCLVDILFVLYFSSPPQHPLVAFLHGGYSGQDAQTEMAYRKSNFFAAGQSNRNTVTGFPAAPPNRLSRAGSGNIELGPVGANGNGNRLSMARSQGGRPLSGIPETHASGARTSGSGADDAQAPLQRPQLQQGQSEGSRKSGRFSLYRREKEREREREREREQQEAASQVQGGSVSGAQGQDSMESRPASRKPVLCKAEALFNYHAASEDPSELSFRKGEVLDILDRSGKWWEGRREDGREGIVPSNYVRVIDA